MRSRSTHLHWPTVIVGSLILAAPLAACGPGFEPSSTVTRPRLVGARLSVVADARRAAPLPGEEATVQPWIVQPEEESLVRASYIVCLAADIRRGASMCASGPLAFVPATPPSVELPPVTFTVPASTPPTAQLILLVLTCDQGATPSLDMTTMLVSCDAPGARAELSTLNLPLAANAMSANRNPEISEETYTVEAEGGVLTWPATTAPLTAGCAASGMPLVRVPRDAQPPTAREPYRINLTFTTSEDDRDAYTTSAGTMLREALLNIVNNAAEACQQNGGSVAIEVRLAGDAGTSPTVQLEIRDTGPGIPRNLLPRLFAPGFTTKENGSGIGLAIAERVVTAHRGRIALDTNIGVGTVVTITLPSEELR